MSKLILYKNPIPLDKTNHKDLKLKSLSNFDFAKGANSLPVAGVEFFKAGRYFPIFFVKGSDDNFIPVVLLSLRKDINDLEGDWDGFYIPIFVRRYPFALADDGMLMIDEEADFLDPKEGKPLFNEEGENTETLKEVINFLKVADVAYKTTIDFTAAIAEKNLFTPFNATVSYETVKVKLDGLYTISEKKFSELDSEIVSDWFSKGWVAWAYGQMNSIESLPALAKLQYQKEMRKSV